MVPGDNGARFAVVPMSSSGLSGNYGSCVTWRENENAVPGYGGSLSCGFVCRGSVGGTSGNLWGHVGEELDRDV